MYYINIRSNACIISLQIGNSIEITFIVVPHTQGAQAWITRFHLQITPDLPLPRKRSPDSASPD